MNEFAKFCPDLRVECYHGSMEEREQLRDRLEEHLPKYRKNTKPSRPLDCIIAPSTYFSKESSDDRKFLCKFKFNYLVVDEAHILKSSKSTRYQQLHKVKSERRLLLTGTPVQNTPRELLNMLSFLMPLFSRPGSQEFGEETSIVDDLLEHFVEDDQGGERDKSEVYKKLKQVFAPFVLRRKKDDVLTQMLPPKQREVRMVEMDPDARRAYESIIHAHVEKNGSKVSSAIGEHLFTNLRKAAHHSLLLRNRHNSPAEIEQLAEVFMKHGAFRGEAVTIDKVKAELSRWNDFNIHGMALDLINERSSRRADLEQYMLDEEALFESAKFRELKILVPDLIEKGHRILIFSSWTSCLDLLECLMRNIGLDFLRMDGSTPGAERQQLIDKFNRDEQHSIFLLSTKGLFNFDHGSCEVFQLPMFFISLLATIS
jgi:SWI/SNF-related matrix-associated actin-dependent regulator of chromatin subfamily A containing DEAD/H box 1